ncbi:unnamed protein product [Haemonchus placei]|uniref:G_PROTEIN_RECEP_F1_2 domain-containing protein n=1 Tax=Haemonchus placei TaxID=6290 RepID=A0A0N4XAL0_HAEPC|nr:unnamed protein product [Haemonchus placei]
MASGLSIYFVSYGPCTAIGSLACFIGFGFMLHCFGHGFWILLYSFAYRYFVLFHPQPRRRTILLTCALLYIPSFSYFIVHCTSGSDEAELKAGLEEKFGFYTRNECVSGNLDCYEWRTLIACLYVNCLSTPIYIVVLILRKLTILKLKSFQTTMSGSTRQLHSQLLTVLTIQACLPLTLILGTVGYLVAQMDIYHHPLVEYCTSFLSVPIPAANSLVSLYFIGPYRNWIRKRLLKYNVINATRLPTNTITTIQSNRRLTFLK